MIYMFAYPDETTRRAAWPWPEDATIPSGQIYISNDHSVWDLRVGYARATYDTDGNQLTPESLSPSFWIAVKSDDAALYDNPACQIELVEQGKFLAPARYKVTPEALANVTFVEPLPAGFESPI